MKHPEIQANLATRQRAEQATFFNRISGDERLGLRKKMIYWGLNLGNNLIPSLDGVGLGIETFTVDDERGSELLATADLTRGPARVLSECFLKDFDWSAARSKFGELHVVDAGCGDGAFAQKLFDFSGGVVRSYVGFDIRERPSWEALRAPNVKLVRARAEDFRRHVPPEANFFFSHSALEHFEQDLTFLSEVRDSILERGKPTLQIHIVPAPVGLALYVFHGYRQYPKRALRRMREVFRGTSSSVRIFAIGGVRSASLHLRRITLPTLRGRGNTPDGRYAEELRGVLDTELRHPRGPACYYALVIETPGPPT